MIERRDIMAPDNEPTDEELAIVMRDALEIARQRRKISDAWIAAKIEEAGQFARQHRMRPEDRNREHGRS